MPSDKMPRLFVRAPIENFNISNPAEAIIEAITTLTFSLCAALALSSTSLSSIPEFVIS
jgi:hypothetical protein